MSTESEMKELESIFSTRKMKRFHGKNKLELENKLWKFVYDNDINIKLLVCRKFRYNVYY